MQLQHTTPYQPDFQARNISRVVSTAQNGVKSVIDIYSADKKDKVFLKRFAEALKGQTLPEDTLMIAGKDAKASVTDALKHVLAPEKRNADGLLIAIEDKKNIAGILDYRENGDMDIHTLFMFKDDKQSMGRKALLIQALKNIKKEVELYAQIQHNRLTEKTEKYYKSLGFGKERGERALLIPDDKLQEKINKLQNNSAISVRELKYSKNVDLSEVLKLDE